MLQFELFCSLIGQVVYCLTNERADSGELSANAAQALSILQTHVRNSGSKVACVN